MEINKDSSREEVLAAVKQDGLTLEYASELQLKKSMKRTIMITMDMSTDFISSPSNPFIVLTLLITINLNTMHRRPSKNS